MEPEDNGVKLEGFQNEGPMIVREREGTRQKLAFRLLWLLSVEAIVLIVGVLFHAITVDAAKDIGLIVIAPTTGVFSVVVGFFFGEGNR